MTTPWADAMETAARFAEFVKGDAPFSQTDLAELILRYGERVSAGSSEALATRELRRVPIEGGGAVYTDGQLLDEGDDGESFQFRASFWAEYCFGHEVASNPEERAHRFTEEAIELAQACGVTKADALKLVDYVFDRPVGDKAQEAGGVMLTLATLCWANEMDMEQAGETELKRVWTKLDVIRQKNATKPRNSPLPGTSIQPADVPVEHVREGAKL